MEKIAGNCPTRAAKRGPTGERQSRTWSLSRTLEEKKARRESGVSGWRWRGTTTADAEAEEEAEEEEETEEEKEEEEAVFEPAAAAAAAEAARAEARCASRNCGRTSERGDF